MKLLLMLPSLGFDTTPGQKRPSLSKRLSANVKPPKPTSTENSDLAMPPPSIFLFSVDLEDVVSRVPDRHRFERRVPRNVELLLRFLDHHRVRCTFFAVGDVARRYPSLIQEIATAGHELACHSSDHTPLDRHSPQSFRHDLEQNLSDLDRAGAANVVGFRAPMCSLTAETS